MKCWISLIETDRADGIYLCPLYNLGLSIREDTLLRVRYFSPTMDNTEKPMEIGIYIDLLPTGGSAKQLKKYLPFEFRGEDTWHDLTINSLADNLQAKANFRGSKIVELGVYCISKHRAEDHTFTNTGMDRPQSAGTKQPFVYLGEISLSRVTTPSYRISSISTDINSSGRTRLSWTIAAQNNTQVREISGPFSEITGPFAYFLVYIDGEVQGVAFSKEFIVSTSFIGELGLGRCMVEGVMWNGDVVACDT